jgi:hypothetical protein
MTIILDPLINKALELNNLKGDENLSSIELINFLSELEELLYPKTQKTFLELGLFDLEKPIKDISSIKGFLEEHLTC